MALSPRTKMRRSGAPAGWARAMARSCSTRPESSTSVSCRKTLPSGFTLMVIGSLSWLIGAAAVLGRSTGTPTVISGAATMKMISSTSITSTMGVTLISAIGL